MYWPPPGRLLDLFRQNALKLSKVETPILDEADRMLDPGSLKNSPQFLRALPKQRQTLLFSATFSTKFAAWPRHACVIR